MVDICLFVILLCSAVNVVILGNLYKKVNTKDIYNRKNVM